MRTETKIGFILLGVLIALLPIFFGDLSLIEKFIVAPGLAALVALGVVFTYNLTNKPASITYSDRMVYSVVGAVIAVIATLLI